jgi:hypothetical protein
MLSRANVEIVDNLQAPIHELSKTRSTRSMRLVAAALLSALSGCVAPAGYYPAISAAVYQPPPPAGVCGVYPYGSADYSTCMSVNYPNVGQDSGTPAAAIATFAPSPAPSFTPPMNTAAPEPIVPPAGTKCQSTTIRTDDPNADSSTTTTNTTCH